MGPKRLKAKRTALFVLAVAAIVAAAAPGARAGREGNDLDLNRFQWENRLLFLFAPDRQTAAFSGLQNEIARQQAGVDDRDMVIFEIMESGPSGMNGAGIAPQAAEALRQKFGAPLGRFTVVLVGKDGGVKMKRHDGVRLEEIFQLIDAMPMRRQEMRGKD